MKLKIFFLSLLLGLISTSAFAGDAGLRFIKSRGKVICGTDFSTKTFAGVDDFKMRRGMDADFCRMIAMAVFGEPESFVLKDIPINKINEAIVNNKIDVMLGNTPTTASMENNTLVSPIDIVYYDKQVFGVKADEPKASSMEGYHGAKVCVLKDSVYEANLREYNHRYGLEFSVLPYPNLKSLREAFYLNRCQLISGSMFYLRGLAVDPVSKSTKMSILPEDISVMPIYAYADRNNSTLRTTIKWIFNAPKLAEQQEISSKNIDGVIGVRDASIENLMGLNPKLWEKFNLQPEWAKNYIKKFGNFGEVYERNLGKDSPLNVDRDKNYLWDRGGMMTSQPFI